MVSYVLDSMENLSGVSPNSRTVLKSLSDLFVLWGITENSGSFLEVRKERHKKDYSSNHTAQDEE